MFIFFTKHFTSVVRIRMRVVEFYCQFTVRCFYIGTYPFELDAAPGKRTTTTMIHTTCFHFQSNHIELRGHNIKATHAYRDHCLVFVLSASLQINFGRHLQRAEQTAANGAPNAIECERMKNCVISKAKGNCLIDRIVCKWKEMNEWKQQQRRNCFFLLSSSFFVPMIFTERWHIKKLRHIKLISNTSCVIVHYC